MRAWELDPACCVLVGDQDSDMATAAAAGIQAMRFTGADLPKLVDSILNSGPSPVP